MKKTSLAFSALALSVSAAPVAAETPGTAARKICKDLKREQGYHCSPLARLRIAALVEEFRKRPQPADKLDAELAYHQAEQRLQAIVATIPSAK